MSIAAVLSGEKSWHIEQAGAVDILRCLPSHSVSAVITDPPYPREYVFLYKEIAAELPRVLTRGGSFLAIVPHYSLPEVLPEVGKYLKYRWTLCMWQEAGNHPRLAMGIEVVWKPLVWWVNGAWPMGRGFLKDGFVNRPPDKTHHRWEQSLTWSDFCLKVVPAGGVVLDPLVGSGTTGVSAMRKGHPFIGTDIDGEAVRTAGERLRAEERDGASPTGRHPASVSQETPG